MNSMQNSEIEYPIYRINITRADLTITTVRFGDIVEIPKAFSEIL